MGNPAPIRVPSDLSGLRTIPEVVRYITAFAQQVAGQFNTLLGTKEVFGTIGPSSGSGNTGTIGVTGSGNFGISFLSTGIYWVSFREPYFTPPVVTTAPNRAPFIAAAENVTNTGFNVRVYDISGNLINVSFSFIAKGARNG